MATAATGYRLSAISYCTYLPGPPTGNAWPRLATAAKRAHSAPLAVQSPRGWNP